MIRITGYSDLERIGHGGLGDVYRATRDSTGGTVAIKVLRDVSDESVAWHRTQRELTALRSLAGHANVIQLIELLDLPEGPALVMEFAPGGSVADLMRRRDGTLTVGEAVFVGRQTASALVAAHDQSIVHRDIKPQNLLIDAYGQVKLCDFGIAAIARSEDFRARTSALSMRYASPEDLDNEVDVGPSSDVYSLGATLLHLARGAPPTLKERLAPWSPPATDDEHLAVLDSIIARCLHPEPNRRPTAVEVLDALERLGWSIDERHRALAFEVEHVDEPDDAPTDVRAAAGSAPDDITAIRPGGTPRPVPEPVAPAAPLRSDSRAGRGPRWRNVLAGAAVVLVVLIVAVVLWPDGAADAPVFGGLEVVERPGGLVALTDESVRWPDGPVGECLVQVAGETELNDIACTEPHDLQRIARDEVTGVADDADLAVVRDAVRAECLRAFEQAVGIPLEESILGAPFTAPSAETVADGDRAFECFVGIDDARLVGDVTGSRR